MSNQLPEGVECNFPLARLTTIRTGGPAQYFARVGDQAGLVELLSWASSGSLEVAVVGSGSNLLVADQGVTGLVLKLDDQLAEIDQDGDQLLCGGGARLPAVAAFAARVGLSGLEFGVNIPGTVGGAVKMNANAYGGQLAEVLEVVELATGSGVEERTPEQLGFSYRHSNLGPEEIVANARFKLQPTESAEVKERLAKMRNWRKEAQPSGIKTFGSTFKNPTDEKATGKTAG